MRNLVLLAGSVAQRPGCGGHTWVFLQYLLGFRRLGWDVLLLDSLSPDMCVDAQGESCSPEQSWNLRYFLEVVERFGLQHCYSLDYNRGQQVLGVPRAEVLARARGSAFLLNVMGYLQDAEILAAVPQRVFLDIDPGFGQMWCDLGLADIFAGHDDFVTVGANVGRPGCDIPACGRRWIAIRPPVVLEHWPVVEASNGRFTSVASWRGLFGPVDYRGKRYGLRCHEFRKFADLPRRCAAPFHLALDIHPHETADLALLTDRGWALDDPRQAAGDPWTYRRYLGQSHAELMVAKHMYVGTRSGWLSDRSACYLASGKPVLAQDTGLSGTTLPAGEGLLLFNTLDDLQQAVAEVQADYPRHARAARRIAEEHFESDRVLRQLIEDLSSARTSRTEGAVA